LGYHLYFKSPFLFWAKKPLRIIPIDPALTITDSLAACAFILNQGKVLCMFPEGARSIDGKIKEFKRGVGILIKELNIPVVPVYISGNHNAWPSYRVLPRPKKIKIIFGRRILPDQLMKNQKENIDIYQNIVDNLRDAILGIKASE